MHGLLKNLMYSSRTARRATGPMAMIDANLSFAGPSSGGRKTMRVELQYMKMVHRGLELNVIYSGKTYSSLSPTF